MYALLAHILGIVCGIFERDTATICTVHNVHMASAVFHLMSFIVNIQ